MVYIGSGMLVLHGDWIAEDWTCPVVLDHFYTNIDDFSVSECLISTKLCFVKILACM